MATMDSSAERGDQPRSRWAFSLVAFLFFLFTRLFPIIPVWEVAEAQAQHGIEQAGIRGKVVVAEQDLSRMGQSELRALQLLDLDHQVGAVRVGGARNDARASCLVRLVGKADARARGSLDVHRVAGARELFHAGGDQADAVFMVLDFLRHTDEHAPAPSTVNY